VSIDLDYLFLVLILCIPAAVFLLPVWWRQRERVRLIEIARAAVEHGQPIPPELLNAMPAQPVMPSPQRDLRNGVLWIAAGAGIALTGLGGRPFFAALLQGDGSALAIGIAALGAIPLTVGIALVVLSRLQRG
jgi:Domain of unknown function (DUF6249)